MNKFICPACGFLVFDAPAGSFDICPICGWEDDLVQLANPNFVGGANKESLFEYQQSIIRAIPLHVEEKIAGYKKVKYIRDPLWRPVTREDLKFIEGSSNGKTINSENRNYYWLK